MRRGATPSTKPTDSRRNHTAHVVIVLAMPRGLPAYPPTPSPSLSRWPDRVGRALMARPAIDRARGSFPRDPRLDRYRLRYPQTVPARRGSIARLPAVADLTVKTNFRTTRRGTLRRVRTRLDVPGDPGGQNACSRWGERWGCGAGFQPFCGLRGRCGGTGRDAGNDFSEFCESGMGREGFTQRRGDAERRGDGTRANTEMPDFRSLPSPSPRLCVKSGFRIALRLSGWAGASRG
ncbi:MAG: hypothetical protein JWN86_3510 [Planctomycetota bacterium]|nr:hypothetical protein [Planctomycetota bacterium]